MTNVTLLNWFDYVALCCSRITILCKSKLFWVRQKHNVIRTESPDHVFIRSPYWYQFYLAWVYAYLSADLRSFYVVWQRKSTICSHFCVLFLFSWGNMGDHLINWRLLVECFCCCSPIQDGSLKQKVCLWGECRQSSTKFKQFATEHRAAILAWQVTGKNSCS